MDKVIVKVVGRHTDAVGEVSTVELMAEGKHYYRNGKHYVLYNDNMMNDGLMTETVLKIAPDYFHLFRKGGVCHDQLFAQDKMSTSTYKTPYGNMQMSVKTDKLNIVYGTVSGNIEVDYAMSVNGQWQSRNELNIEVSIADGNNAKLN